MFGGAPKTGPDRAYAETDSFLWITLMMQIAAMRLKHLRAYDGSDAGQTYRAQAVAEVCAMAPATLADRLAKGWKAYSALLADNAPGAAEGFQPPFSPSIPTRH